MSSISFLLNNRAAAPDLEQGEAAPSSSSETRDAETQTTPPPANDLDDFVAFLAQYEAAGTDSPLPPAYTSHPSATPVPPAPYVPRQNWPLRSEAYAPPPPAPPPPCADEIVDSHYNPQSQMTTHIWRSRNGNLYISTTMQLPSNFLAPNAPARSN